MTTEEQRNPALDAFNRLCKSKYHYGPSGGGNPVGPFRKDDIEIVRAALQPSEAVDVEGLKRLPADYLPTSKRDHQMFNEGWNRCLAFLQRTNRLRTSPEKVTWLEINSETPLSDDDGPTNIEIIMIDDDGRVASGYNCGNGGASCAATGRGFNAVGWMPLPKPPVIE